MKRRRHTPEQIVRKLREVERLLGEGQTIARGNFYEGRSFRKADVAASLARRCRLVDAGPLVMSGSGACAELLFALSLGRALGPVHEGTILLPGGAAI